MKQLKHLLNKKSLNLYLGFVIKAFFIRLDNLYQI
jgi:hypothetical protein